MQEGDYFFGFRHEQDDCIYFQRVDRHQKPSGNLFLKELANGDIIRTTSVEFFAKKQEMCGVIDDEDFVGQAYIAKGGELMLLGLTTSRIKLKRAGLKTEFRVYHHHSTTNKMWAVGLHENGENTEVFALYETPQSEGQKILYTKHFGSETEARAYIEKKCREKERKGYTLVASKDRFDWSKSVFF